MIYSTWRSLHTESETVFEAVCKRDWHNVFHKVLLIFQRAKILDLVCNGLK